MRFINPNYQGENKGHYSPAVSSNGMLYISGQLSIDPDTRAVSSGGVAEHVGLALSNLDRVLSAAGLGRESVVQCRVYITDMEKWDEVNAVYGEFFGSHRPARCVVPVPCLHFGCLAEIEAIAEAGER